MAYGARAVGRGVPVVEAVAKAVKAFVVSAGALSTSWTIVPTPPLALNVTVFAAASIVMVKVCVAVTPSASLMLTEPEEKVPVAVEGAGEADSAPAQDRGETRRQAARSRERVGGSPSAD